MSADLIDDEHGIAYTGDEAIENHAIVEWAIKELARRNGGAATVDQVACEVAPCCPQRSINVACPTRFRDIAAG